MEMIPVPFTDLDIHHTRLNQWFNTIFIQCKSVLYHRLQISFETVHVREKKNSTKTHKIMRKKMWKSFDIFLKYSNGRLCDGQN